MLRARMAASVSILANSAAVSNTKDSRFCATQDKTIIAIIITKDPQGLSFPNALTWEGASHGP